jgi:hypothetical protein
MQHIDEAVLHEYLDRGAVDERLQSAAEHIATCDACQARLRSVELERSAASVILRAAAPSRMAVPSFEALPRAPFETLDAGYNTDLSAFNPGAQFKMSSLGMRGQAIALAWAATIVMAIGAGWFASELYRTANEIAPIAKADTTTDSIAPMGPPVPVLTSAESATQANAPDATNPVATRARTQGPVAMESSKAANADARTDALSAGAMSGAAPSPTPTLQPTNALAQVSIADSAAESKAAAERDRSAEASTAAARKAASATPPASPAPPAVPLSRTFDAAPGANRFAVGASSDVAISARMLSDSSWRSITSDSARKALGGTVVRLRSARVIGYSESADSLPQRILMRQITAGGDTVDIIQTRPKSLAQGPSNPLGKPPAMLARVVVEGATGRRYYETLKWSDDRLVTIVAKDVATIRALKEDLLGER